MTTAQRAASARKSIAADSHRTWDNVFEALFDDPGDVAVLTLQSNLAILLCSQIDAWALPPREAARRLGTNQRRLAQLRRGRISRFSLEDLLRFAARAGLQPSLTLAGQPLRPDAAPDALPAGNRTGL